MKTVTKIMMVAAVAVLVPGIASAATLSVSPAKQTVKVGETFTVTVGLDTQGASIDGVDLRYLTFNQAVLQVEDSNTSQGGTQIGAENLMALTVLNSADNALGRIAFSQVAAGGTKYKGKGTLATIKFKAIAPGTAAVAIGYTPKNTTDSNVAAGGTDVLTAVINGSYTVTGSGPIATPPKPTPTKTPTTQPGQTQTVTPNQGTPVVEDPATTIPASDDTAFQYTQKKTFWQIVREMIVNYFVGFKTRVSSIFN